MAKMNHGETFVFYANVENLHPEKVEAYVEKVRGELAKVGATANNTAIIPTYTGETRLERI